MKYKDKQNNKDKAVKNKHNKWLKIFIVVLIVIAAITLCFFVFKFTGLWEKVNSIDKIQKIVESGGVFSFLVFIIFQILQTTILQIPSIIVTIAGTFIFGAWQTFILSFIAIMIGSIIMFWVGRKGGKKFLNWLIGKEETEKWVNKMSNGKYLFFLMMMFPLFPDDILCVVAGLTNMSFNFFFWTNIIARGMGIACTVFFGSGQIVPFHSWGIVVWILIAIFMVTLFYISIRYKDKIDEILNSFTKNKK